MNICLFGFFTFVYTAMNDMFCHTSSNRNILLNNETFTAFTDKPEKNKYPQTGIHCPEDQEYSVQINITKVDRKCELVPLIKFQRRGPKSYSGSQLKQFSQLESSLPAYLSEKLF